MPVRTENERFVKDRQTPSKAYRPAGFGYAAAKRSAAEENETANEEQKASSKRGLFAFLKRDKNKKKRIKKAPKKRVKKSRTKTKRKHIGRTELVAIGVILLVIAAGTTAVIIINGSKTIHQMPVILRNTEEPTEAPESE